MSCFYFVRFPIKGEKSCLYPEDFSNEEFSTASFKPGFWPLQMQWDLLSKTKEIMLVFFTLTYYCVKCPNLTSAMACGIFSQTVRIKIEGRMRSLCPPSRTFCKRIYGSNSKEPINTVLMLNINRQWDPVNRMTGRLGGSYLCMSVLLLWAYLTGWLWRWMWRLARYCICYVQ